MKQDGSKAQLNEKLPFKVLEFNKDSRRILLSHTRTFDEAYRLNVLRRSPAALLLLAPTRKKL